MVKDLLDNLGALLISNSVNIRYLTGFVGSVPNEREAYVLITSKRLYLFTNELYLEQAQKLVDRPSSFTFKSNLQIEEISREHPLSTALYTLLTKLKITRLGFEQNNLTFKEYKKLKKELRNIQLVPTNKRVEDLRKIKRPDEIDNIMQAAKLTDQCFKFILTHLKIGVTEQQIAWRVEKFIREKRQEMAFPPIVAFGKNTSMPHYNLSNNQRLKIKDIVLIDFGARVNGYCSDMTRVVFIGKPSLKQQKAYQLVLTSQQKVLNKLTHSCAYMSIYQNRRTRVKKKISGAKLDQIAKNEIKKAGYIPYPHSLGHCVGLDIHEQPRLTIKKDAQLKPGMVFTVEPAIYLQDKFGIRIEDLVWLRKDGIEILSKSPKKMLVLK